MADAKAYVVDSGVFLRWYVPQDGYEHAREVRDAFLGGRLELCAPDCARYEVAHALRTKGLEKRRLDEQEFLAAAGMLDDLGLTRPVEAAGISRAATLAARRKLRFYDAVFIDTALTEGLPLLTTDARLLRAAGDLVDIHLLRGIGAED